MLLKFLGSHSITDERQHWARVVIGWDTPWELLALLTLVQVFMLLRGKIRGPGFKPIFSISVPENCLSALFVGRRVLYLNCLQSSMTQSRANSKHPASIEQQTSQTKTFFALAVESASVSQSGKITCSPPNGMGVILHGVLENSGEACPVRSTQESETWSYEDGNAERNLI